MSFDTQVSYSGRSLGEDGLQLRFDKLLWREDDSMSNLDRVGDEGTLRNEFGESKLGSISAPIKPLQIFVLANVALALKAAPDRQEKLLVFWILIPGTMLYPSGTSQEPSLWPLH